MARRTHRTLVTEDEAKNIALKVAETEGLLEEFEMGAAYLVDVPTPRGVRQCWWVSFNNLRAERAGFHPSVCAVEIDAQTRKARLCVTP